MFKDIARHLFIIWRVDLPGGNVHTNFSSCIFLFHEFTEPHVNKLLYCVCERGTIQPPWASAIHNRASLTIIWNTFEIVLYTLFVPSRSNELMGLYGIYSTYVMQFICMYPSSITKRDLRDSTSLHNSENEPQSNIKQAFAIKTTFLNLFFAVK